MDQFPLYFGLVCGGFFFLFVLAAGVGLLIFGSRSKKKSDLSQGWPSVTGKVLASSVRESRSNEDNGVKVAYYPDVAFQYEVAGKDYSSKNRSFGAVTPLKSQEAVLRILEQYPVDSTLLVYYDPQNPTQAVIERAADGIKWVLVLGILALIVAGCTGLGLLVSLITYFT